MSFEISEQDGDETSSSDGDNVNFTTFVEEFVYRVSIKTIMSGIRSIGRNEARLMIAQFRGCTMEQVPNSDPGVLMLDGLPISELEEYIESGGASLEEAIRGIETNDFQTFETNNDTQNNENNDNNNALTISDLRTALDNFRSANSENEKEKHRNEFYKIYISFSENEKSKLPQTTQSQISETIGLEVSYQDTLLMTVSIPMAKSQSQPQTAMSEGHTAQSQLGTTSMGTSHFGENYHGRSVSNLQDRTNAINSSNDLRRQVASMESKNIAHWICSNLGSQHVWFFFAGIFLFIVFFIQIWVDYAFGEMWRAVLMELLCLNAILICMMEADTQFIRSRIQERLYNYYQFLANVQGRTWTYAMISFLAFGKLTIFDSMAIFGGFVLLSLTVTRYILYKWSETCLDDYIVTLRDGQVMRDVFKSLDEDNDGYLMLNDMSKLIEKDFSRCCFYRGWLKEIIFWRLDSQTNDGRVDCHEFVQFCLAFKQTIQTNQDRRESRKNELYPKQ